MMPARMIQGFDLFFLAYLFSTGSLTFLYRDGIPLWPSLLQTNLVMFALWLLVVWTGEKRGKGLFWFLRNWYLCAGFPILFTELQHIIHRVRPTDLDPLLVRMDYFLFGCHPTVWLERFIHPWLTTVLQVCYISYFFLVLPLGGYLWVRKREDFQPYVTTVSLMFFSTLLGYLLVPALGPRYELASLQTVPLEGIGFVQALMHWVNTTEGVCRDCFPSGHVAMATLVCIFSYRLCRPLFPFYMIVCTGLFMGTVYLRYHYVVDLPAGLLLGVFCAGAGPWFHEKWKQSFSRHVSMSFVLEATEKAEGTTGK